jgi:hypothetical protein
MSFLAASRRKLLAASLAVVAALAAGGVYAVVRAGGEAPPATGQLWVDANGGSCARQSPPGEYVDAWACSSLRAAYAAASSGDTVRVKAGTYGVQAFAGGRDPATGSDTPVGVGDVTFIGEPKTTIRQLFIQGSGITIDGFDIVGAGKDIALAMGTLGGTLRNSRVGNVVDNKGAIMGAANQTIDNVHFHDVTYNGSGDVHGECLFIGGPDNLVLRNSTFTNCFVMDVNMHADGALFDHVTIENNVFGHSTNGSATAPWASYGFVLGSTAPGAGLPACAQNGQNPDAVWLKGWRVVNNTFENSFTSGFGNGCGVDSVWANNIGTGWKCMEGVTFSGNVGTRCGRTDTAAAACSQASCPFGFVDRRRWNFHLAADSPAIGAADPAYATATDRDGVSRGSDPDAGAYEHGD